MRNKRKCVDCQEFYKITALANHVRKTTYCIIGQKTVFAHSDKSVACSKFKQRIHNEKLVP